ncbi:hypothetical protein [Streptomyces virginiae]|uniref:hypothetical protein n=1 Tax=Streptomyces virginiae TaxID=1961 RepID=UPI0035DB85FA
MDTRAGTSAAAMMLAVSVLCVSGCGADPATGVGAPATAAASKPGAGKDSGVGQGGSAATFSTVFNTKEKIQAALPDPASMKGWKPKTGIANVKEQLTPSAQCGPDWECPAIADGRAKFEEVGESVIFRIYAYADEATAQDACRKEAAKMSKYTKAEVAPLEGASSHAYYRNAGGLDGIHVSLCLGTVFGEVTIEGGGSDLSPDTAHSMARTFIERVRKAAEAA